MRIRSHYPLFIITVFTVLSVAFVVAQGNPPTKQVEPASFANPTGWSCDDFPCEDDIDGFLNRIQVPSGFALSYIGRFPGQPMQIAYSSEGRLHATVLEKGTRRGAVYAMNPDRTIERVSPRFWSPVGIAFDESGQLFVSSRLKPDSVGVLWRVQSPLLADVVVDSLPCCYSIDNQPNGMTFGTDGLLYVGVGSLSDRGESQTPERERFATPQPFEASIIQIDVTTGEVQLIAGGIRNPYDVDIASTGELYVTDNGLLTGPGDRILNVQSGLFYGFPYWRSRGCSDCPPREGQEVTDDWLLLPDYTLPRGLAVYDGVQFPQNFKDTLFVALWNGTESAQRIVWIDPDDESGNDDYIPQPFVTGLIRPVDVVVAPDGSLVVADFVYGHIWRVSYDELGSTETLPPVIQTVTSNDTSSQGDLPPVIATVVSNSSDNTQIAPATPTPNPSGIIFATATP